MATIYFGALKMKNLMYVKMVIIMKTIKRGLNRLLKHYHKVKMYGLNLTYGMTWNTILITN